MKHKMMKTLFTTLTAMALAMGLGLTASAKTPVIKAEGNKLQILEAGSDWTSSDLFRNFKGVMPGDKLTQEITLENRVANHDNIEVFLKAVPRNPLSPKVAAKTGKAEAEAFLAKLKLRVFNTSGKLISEGPASAAGALKKPVLVANLRKGATAKMKVELEVPAALDNAFKSRVGEVDWVFMVRALKKPVNLSVRKVWSDDGKGRPSSVDVTLMNGGKAYATVKLSAANHWSHTWTKLSGEGDWQVVETNVPKNYAASYSVEKGVVVITNTSSLIYTGQLNWPIPVLGGLGVILVSFGLVFVLKKRKDEEA